MGFVALIVGILVVGYLVGYLLGTYRTARRLNDVSKKEVAEAMAEIFKIFEDTNGKGN